MKRKFLLLFVLAAAFMATQDAFAVLVTFDDLPLNQVYNVGNYCPPGSIEVEVQQFFPVVGGPLNGNAKVDNFRMAGALGNELTMNNANVNFTLDFEGCSACGIAFMFADLGGDINLGINGDLRKAANFTNLPSAFGGAKVSIFGSSIFGILMITGNDIRRITIGGQGYLLIMPLPKLAMYRNLQL